MPPRLSRILSIAAVAPRRHVVEEHPHERAGTDASIDCQLRLRVAPSRAARALLRYERAILAEPAEPLPVANRLHGEDCGHAGRSHGSWRETPDPIACCADVIAQRFDGAGDDGRVVAEEETAERSQAGGENVGWAHHELLRGPLFMAQVGGREGTFRVASARLTAAATRGEWVSCALCPRARGHRAVPPPRRWPSYSRC